MANQKIEIEVDVPEGFQAVAYRPYGIGEWYLHQSGPKIGDCNAIYPWLILRKVEPVRESRWYPASLEWGYVSLTAVRSAYPTGPYVRIAFENGVPVYVTLEPKEPQ